MEQQRLTVMWLETGMQEAGFPPQDSILSSGEQGMHLTSNLRGLKSKPWCCSAPKPNPFPSSKAGWRWKPTQGLAPTLPDPGKHETITDETRLESRRA